MALANFRFLVQEGVMPLGGMTSWVEGAHFGRTETK